MSDQWLKEALDKLDNKVDRIDQRLDNLDITSVKQSLILDEHQRRSLANEESVSLLRQEFKPVERHVIIFNGILKAVGVLATMSGVATGLLKLVEMIKL